MDMDSLVLQKELSQVSHSLFGLRKDDGLVGSEEEVLDLNLDTLFDMLHIEIEGISYEAERIILRHISLRAEAGDIVALGERRLDKSVIRRLGGIERYRVIERSDAGSSLNRLLGLLIIDIHT